MYTKIKNQLSTQIDEIREAGLYKSERIIESPQEARIKVGDGEVLNMCANNYLGLSDHPDIVEAAHKALDDWGFWTFIGTFYLRNAGDPQRTRIKDQRFPWNGRHDSLHVLF